MKYKILTAIILMSGVVFAQAPIPLTIDSRAPTAPAIDPYQASRTVYRVTFTDGTNLVNLTGITGWMSWSTNAYANTCATAAVAVVSTSDGIIDFTFSPSDLNYTPGRYLYEAGLRGAAGITVYRQGIITIRGSPYAAGVSPAAWTTNAVNWGLINWIGLPTTMAGYGIVDGVDRTEFMSVSNQVTTAQDNIDTHEALTGTAAHGLGTAAIHGSNEFATAAQGTLAGTALQAEADTNAIARLNSHTNTAATLAHSGLGTAAVHASNEFATAAQGALADTALQSEADTNAIARLNTHTNLSAMAAHSGLGTAATNPASAFATSAQGATADTAGGNATAALAGVLTQSNRIDMLDTATNALNASVAGLKLSTNALHVRVGALELATNSLQTQVTALSTNAGSAVDITALQAATNSMTIRIAATEAGTNALNTRMISAETVTNYLSGQVTSLKGATNNLAGRVSGIEGNTSKWESAYVNASTATSAIPRITTLEGKTSGWDKAKTDSITATNAIPRITALEANTNALNTRMANSEGATNYLSSQVTALKSSTNTLQIQATAASAATNALQVQATALQGATSSLNTKVTALQTVTNALDNRIETLENAGYLTASTNLFTSVTVADRSQLGTNIAGLTQGTYTGVISSVSFTGVTELVAGKTYQWGFTKQNAFGTSTLSIASFSLARTAAGAVSNYFTFAGTDTNLVLRLDGDGSSKSDVSAVYVNVITGGSMNVAADLNVGGTVYMDGAAIVNPAAHIAAEGTNVHGLGTMAQAATDDYYTASAGVVLSARIGTNEAFATAQALTNAMFDAQIGSNTAFAVAQGNTNSGFNGRIGAVEGATGALNTALGNLADATNYLNSVMATGTPLYVESYLGTVIGASIAAGDADAVTTNAGMLSITWNTNAAGGGTAGIDTNSNFIMADGTTGSFHDVTVRGVLMMTNSESAGVPEAVDIMADVPADDSYNARRNGVWTNLVAAGLFATGTPLYVESYVGTVIGASIAAGDADAVTTNAGMLSITWNTNAAGGGGTVIENDPVFTNWFATQTFVQAETDSIATNMIEISSNHFQTTKLDLSGGTMTGALKVHPSLAIGTDAPQPSGTGAVNFGKSSSDMFATGIGAMNAGVDDWIMTASGIGSMNAGQVEGNGGTMTASGVGSMNRGYAGLSGSVNNSGTGSIALADNSGSISLTHGASIILGNGTSQEDRSLLADVVRARENFIGNGAGLTNLVEALPKSATNALAVTELQITGGSPTNGAIFLATNTAGDGAWQSPSRIFAYADTAQVFPIAQYTNILWNTTSRAEGNVFWDGMTWIPRDGWLKMTALIVLDSAAATGYSWLRLIKNGVINYDTQSQYMSAKTFPYISGNWLIYNPQNTNRYSVALYHSFATTRTNLVTGYSYIGSEVSP